MNKIQNIVILAGGESNRFWPLSDKSTFKFLSQPLVFYQIHRLLSYADTLHIVAGSENIESLKSIAKSVDSNVKVHLQQKKGMGGALLSVPNLRGEVLVSNANDFFGTDPVEELLSRKDQMKADVIITAKKMETYFPGGYLKLSGDNVVEIIEKPDPSKVPSQYVKVVIDYFANIEDFIKVLTDTKTSRDDWYEVGISNFIKKKKTVKFLSYEDDWVYLKYPWHTLSLMRYFLSFIDQNYVGQDVHVAQSAVIVPPVFISDGVKIGNFAKIVGPCFIDKGAVIADYAIIRESQVGAEVLIGGYSEVTRSYIGDNVMLHRNYVGDSVLDSDVFLGADVVATNFRFDGNDVKSMVKGEKIDTGVKKLGTIVGKGSKLGSNTTVLPGVKIGKNTFIGPGEVVREDVKDDLYVFQGKNKENKRNKNG